MISLFLIDIDSHRLGVYLIFRHTHESIGIIVPGWKRSTILETANSNQVTLNQGFEGKVFNIRG